jgi:hypothetical protein
MSSTASSSTSIRCATRRVDCWFWKRPASRGPFFYARWVTIFRRAGNCGKRLCVASTHWPTSTLLDSRSTIVYPLERAFARSGRQISHSPVRPFAFSASLYKRRYSGRSSTAARLGTSSIFICKNRCASAQVNRFQLSALQSKRWAFRNISQHLQMMRLKYAKQVACYSVHEVFRFAGNHNTTPSPSA